MTKFDSFLKKIKYPDPRNLKINNVEIDYEIKDIIYRINESDWCSTVWCCAGHFKESSLNSAPYIVFIVENSMKNTFFSYLHQTINRSKNKSILPLSSPIAMNISLGYYDKHYSMISVHWYLSDKYVLSKLHKNLEVFSYKVKYAKNNRSGFGYQHSL